MRFASFPLGFALAPLVVALFAAPPDEEEEEGKKGKAAPAAMEAAPRMQYDFEMDAIDAELSMPAAEVDGGVQVGGAKDVSLLRRAVNEGRVPRPEEVVGEGLLAEHDLPLRSDTPCALLLCVRTSTTSVELLADSATHYLAQIGFSSAIDPSTLGRPPLNLVIAVDRSESMRGHAGLVDGAIDTILAQLDSADQVAIVDIAERPQPGPVIGGADAHRFGLGKGGSYGGATNLEAGLHRAFVEARRNGERFSGASRVILVSDALPNVQSTDVADFVALAEAASRHGVSLTTVGVGQVFGIDLARKMSSVRGGNLVFLRDVTDVQERFGSDFMQLVTELAHELTIEIRPAPGMRIADVHGVPADVLERRVEHGQEVVRIAVATLFPSKRAGAIFVALAPVGRADLPRVVGRSGKRVGEVAFTFRELDGQLQLDRDVLLTTPPARVGDGLRRGTLLVDELATLRLVAANAPGNGESAAILRRLTERMRVDAELQPEVELLERLLGIVGG